MNAAHDPWKRANYLIRKADHAQWHRTQSKQQILRSQLGFTELASSRPKACQGCENYHGIAYGYNRATRTVLICAFHPYGWNNDDRCPDWSNSSKES